MKYAVIDIGSNSVRLMLSADGKTLFKAVKTTRLGSNLAENGNLSEEAIRRTLQAVSEFCAHARREGARIYAFATAAVRTARNGEAFCRRAKMECGVSVDVVSGEDEAMLGVLGALGGGDGGIIDIGGASTEVCLRKNGETVFSVSMNVGAVRLYDSCGDNAEKLSKSIDSAILALNGVNADKTIYAVGGTASTLASVKLGLSHYDAEKLNGLPLEADWVEQTANRLLGMTAQERAEIAGMERTRSDVIAGAAYLLSKIMKKLSCREIVFSDRDNLEGYLTYRGLE